MDTSETVAYRQALVPSYMCPYAPREQGKAPCQSKETRYCRINYSSSRRRRFLDTRYCLCVVSACHTTSQIWRFQSSMPGLNGPKNTAGREFTSRIFLDC